MIDDQLHPLDEVQLFGCTWHGLSSAGKVDIGDVEWPLPSRYSAPTSEDTHLLRVPGVGPVDLTAEQIAVEASAGRAWQDYALLSGSRQGLFGFDLFGWVYIDDDGRRWHIKYGSGGTLDFGDVDVTGPLTLDFEVRPFGYLGEPHAAPATVSVTLADLQQAGIAVAGDPSHRLLINSVASRGQAVVILIHQDFFVDITRPPIGALLLSLSGPGDALTMSLTVLYSRAECLGVFNIGETSTATVHALQFDAVVTATGTAPHRVLSADVTGGAYVPLPGPGVVVGWVENQSSISDRIVQVVFDEFDSLVTFKADIVTTARRETPPPVVTASGSFTWNEGTSTSADTGEIVFSLVGQTMYSGHTVLTLKRDGSALDVTEFRGQHTNHWVGSGVWSQATPLGFDPPDYYIAPVLENYANRDIIGRDATMTLTAGGVEYLNVSNGGQLDYQPLLGHSVPMSFDHGLSSPDVRAEGWIRRCGNQMVACGVRMNRTDRRERKLFAPAASWSNPSTGPDSLPIAATYHPVTHEIVADTAGVLPRPFCWI